MAHANEICTRLTFYLALVWRVVVIATVAWGLCSCTPQHQPLPVHEEHLAVFGIDASASVDGMKMCAAVGADIVSSLNSYPVGATLDTVVFSTGGRNTPDPKLLVTARYESHLPRLASLTQHARVRREFARSVVAQCRAALKTQNGSPLLRGLRGMVEFIASKAGATAATYELPARLAFLTDLREEGDDALVAEIRRLSFPTKTSDRKTPAGPAPLHIDAGLVDLHVCGRSDSMGPEPNGYSPDGVVAAWRKVLGPSVELRPFCELTVDLEATDER